MESRLKNLLPGLAFLLMGGIGLLVIAQSLAPKLVRLSSENSISLENSRARTGRVPPPADASKLQSVYARWKSAFEQGGGLRNLRLALGWSQPLSAEHVRAKGEVTFDLEAGKVALEVWGLGADDAYEVWLIDNQPGPGRSVKPEPGDAMKRLGNLKAYEGGHRFFSTLDPADFEDFHIDLVAVVQEGKTPGNGGLLFGSPSLFQRIYLDEITRARASGGASLQRAGLMPGWHNPFAPPPRPRSFADLVRDGQRLFFEETFSGNGRTCETCHRQENNFTLDSAFIATLPPTDPLFVAEFVDSLNFDRNGGRYFENPTLMRRGGLIVVNADGTEDLATKFVMRSPNHLLAMGLTITPGVDDSTTIPPDHRTGWGGDGAPGSGTLRDFTTGAVSQHFTQTLSREEGVDYRLPTDLELDALEAFMLTLGRQEELDLPAMEFLNADVIAGKDLFLGDAKCNTCHANAGATFEDAPGENRNFDTNVEDFSNPFSDLGEPMPLDGGFGLERIWVGGFQFGNGTFNPPPLVEAADTAPFFHNNAALTLEDAVAFYNSDQFDASPGGLFVGGIDLDSVQVDQIAAFLRVLNALENIRAVIECHDRLRTQTDLSAMKASLVFCMADNEDAVEVLTESPLGLHPVAVDSLTAALDDQSAAAAATTVAAFIAELDNALVALEAARADMLVETVEDLAVTITPVGGPIVIPPEGGSFQYDLSVTNNTAASMTVDIWIVLSGPGVSITLGPVTRTLVAGESLSPRLTQNVPASAPAGTYTMTASAGSFPIADASDSFDFEKTAAKGNVGVAVNDWASTFDLLAEAARSSDVPDRYELEQNYPNPFNSTTEIRFRSPEAGVVQVRVFDVQGREVARLVDGVLPAGAHSVRWEARANDGRPLPSGVYFYQLTARDFEATRQMILVK